MSTARRKRAAAGGAVAAGEKPKPQAPPRLALVAGASFDEGEWQTFMGRTRVQIRHVYPRKLRELRVSVGLPAYREPGERLDDERAEALKAAITDWVIQAWEHVVAPDGSTVPCDTAAKLALVDTNEIASQWIQRVSEGVGHAHMLRSVHDSGN